MVHGRTALHNIFGPMPDDFALNITVEPAAEPVSTQEAKDHLRITGADATENTLIDTYIKAARKEVEGFTGRQLITATYELKLDRFPDEFRIPRPPLLGITSIQYVDESEVTQTLATDQFDLDTDSFFGRVVPAFNVTWPTTLGHINDVTVTYTAGYGTAGSDVPANIVHAIKLMIGELYENREIAIIGTIQAQLPTFGRLLWVDRAIW